MKECLGIVTQSLDIRYNRQSKFQFSIPSMSHEKIFRAMLKPGTQVFASVNEPRSSLGEGQIISQALAAVSAFFPHHVVPTILKPHNLARGMGEMPTGADLGCPRRE